MSLRARAEWTKRRKRCLRMRVSISMNVKAVTSGLNRKRGIAVYIAVMGQKNARPYSWVPVANNSLKKTSGFFYIFSYCCFMEQKKAYPRQHRYRLLHKLKGNK